ncbi:histidine kinase [Oscillochloris trichoides DG-6]|uniref:histidine kinase n=1 Tax=Oscillochloris trichoides DG-6 TaxID=765420 RepID=E1IIC5_9CHLR|nr:ATP-binding protein [Oscillochloris trichoides]EFO79075.1 histidine kinase [Oscillochloris trichoides DG-6]
MRRFISLRWKLFASYVVINIFGMLLLIGMTHMMVVGSVSGTVTDPNEPMVTEEEALFVYLVDEGVIASAVTVMIFSVIVSNEFAQRIIQPIKDLSLASQEIAHGSYHIRLKARAEDELAVVGRSMNQLATSLEQTEQRRMALLSDVAHELRTPIMTIDSYAEGMIDGVIASDPANLAIIQREAARMRRLVDDFSLLSRAEAGQLTVNLQPLDLAQVVGYLTAQFRPECEDEGISLVVNLPAHLPLVYADQQRIEQVLINVLVNAIRYTPPGGTIKIRAELHPGSVRLLVQDSGIGIAPDQLPMIFDRFYRVDASRSRHSGGAGVGLTISRHLMHAQHGDIWAESPGLGAGSTFVIVLRTNGVS